MVGTWLTTPYGEIHVQVTSVDQQSNGELEPPVTAKEIYYACGRSLGRPIKARASDDHTMLRMELNEYLEKSVVFMRLEDGLEDKALPFLPGPAPSPYRQPPSAARQANGANPK
jgi:hypothetical protein